MKELGLLLGVVLTIVGFIGVVYSGLCLSEFSYGFYVAYQGLNFCVSVMDNAFFVDTVRWLAILTCIVGVAITLYNAIKVREG